MKILRALGRYPREALALLKSKIRYKLFFIYVFMITVPILFFGFLSVVLSSNVIESNFISYKDRLNDQIIAGIEENIHSLTQQSMAIYTHLNDIMYIVNTPIEEFDQRYPDTYSRVYNYMQTILQGSDRISSLSLIGRDGTIRFYGSKYYGIENNYNVSNEKWFSQVLSSKGPPVLLEPHYNNFLVSNRNLVLTIARPVIDLSDYKSCGIILLDQDMSRFSELFSSIELEAGETLAVLGESGDIIYTNGNLGAKDYRQMLEKQNARSSSFKYTLYGQQILVSQKMSEEYLWKVVFLMPVSELEQQSQFLRSINFTLLAVLVVFTFIISMFTSSFITRPLKRLISSFKRLQKGNFKTSVEIKGNDELAEIGKTFNDMVVNMKALIEEKYEMNLLRKQAELESLQSQINPHFLFNTLTSIKTVIDRRDTEKSSLMVQNLSEIFRYSLNRGRHIVMFWEELEHVKKYLYIQESRFEGKYTVSYDIDDEVLKCPIVRLTLQPIVENALYHGLETRRGKGELKITARVFEDTYFVYISDNGIGIPIDELEQMNLLLRSDPDVQKSMAPEKLGIFNVNARIRYYFGSAYGIKLYSTAASGTAVKITLPCEDKAL